MTLEDFLHARVRSPGTHLSLAPATRESLAEIETRPDAETIELTGLDQATFEFFVETYANRFRGISFFKCPRLPDLSPLAGLGRVEYLHFYWNQRAEKLWGMSGNLALKGVSLRDFTRLHDLEALTAAPVLEEIEFGDAIWDGLVLETLDPLPRCEGLRTLNFSAKKILDGRIEPLADIPRLEKLGFPGNLFQTEQVAWLKARLGDRVESKVLAPYWTIESPLTVDGKTRDTFIVGKRKPFLSSKDDRDRIDRYVARFEKMVAEYTADPKLAPPKIKIATRKPRKKS